LKTIDAPCPLFASHSASIIRRLGGRAVQVRDRTRYVALYEQHRQRPLAGLPEQPLPATAEDTAELRALEDRLETTTIILYRRVAQAQLRARRRATKDAL
jgi:hypothetical protein